MDFESSLVEEVYKKLGRSQVLGKIYFLFKLSCRLHLLVVKNKINREIWKTIEFLREKISDGLSSQVQALRLKYRLQLLLYTMSQVKKLINNGNKPLNSVFSHDLFQSQIQWCPVLRPTIKEFKNFFQYVEKLDKLYKDKYGMVKVVPPPEWKARSAKYDEALQGLNINGPIEQNIFGKSGVYECLHIQKKSLTLKEYKLKTGIFDKITNDLSAEEVQQMFWKNVVYSPPLYGADLLNTLMDEKAGSWNLGNLDSLLSYSMQTKVKGVNTPYCYIGSWKTLFCWHKEDLDLSAINYLHEGKSKFWYSIPENQGYILQKQAKKLFPEHFSKCDQFLRHKTSLINPYLLKKQYPQLKISKMEHKANQFFLVFGGAYHCGFNFGCNIAEAVNYGTLDWLRQVISAKSCGCSKSSVRASHLQIYRNLIKSPYKKHPAFLEFQQKLFQQIEEQQSEQNSEDVRNLKSQFTKKIKKGKKLDKLKFKGQEYDIDSWAQCDKCKLWRKTKKSIGQNDEFYCKNAGKKCYNKQKIGKNYITLQNL